MKVQEQYIQLNNPAAGVRKERSTWRDSRQATRRLMEGIWREVKRDVNMFLGAEEKDTKQG